MQPLRTQRLLLGASIVVILVLATSSLPTHADDGWEGGLLAGVTRFERALTRDSPSFEPTLGLRVGYLFKDSPSFEPTLGLRVGYLFKDHFGWYLDAVHAATETAMYGDAAVTELRTGLDYRFHPDRKANWFVGAGGGVMRIHFDERDGYGNAIFSTGFGQRIRTGARMHVRWEFRIDVSTSRGGFHKTLNDGKILVGWIWGSRR